MYFLIYKTTCLVNNKIYVGQHKTENKNDGYLGSGKALVRDIKKFGRDKFERIILFECASIEEMGEKEKEIVNAEYTKRLDTYNICIGSQGKEWYKKCYDTISVKDIDGNYFRIKRDDPKYISGEVLTPMTGLTTVKNKEGNNIVISIDDPRYISGEFVSVNCCIVSVKDSSNKIFRVSCNDERYISGELISNVTGMKPVKDKDGIRMLIHKDDIRLLSSDYKSYNPSENTLSVIANRQKYSDLYEKLTSSDFVLPTLNNTSILKYGALNSTCKICGNLKKLNKCYSICNNYQLPKALVKYFSLKEEIIGTNNIGQEVLQIYIKVCKALSNIDKLSVSDLCRQHNHYDAANFHKLIKALDKLF